jgi:hypothetical protein
LPYLSPSEATDQVTDSRGHGPDLISFASGLVSVQSWRAGSQDVPVALPGGQPSKRLMSGDIH